MKRFIKKSLNKPKILLIPDKPGWAYDIRAGFLIKYLKKYYNFEKQYFDDFVKNKNIREINWQKYNCVFFFFWQHPQWLNFYPPKEKTVVGVFSQASWENQKRNVLKELKKFKAVVVNSPFLYKYFKTKVPHVFKAYNAVDEKMFKPKKKNHEKFVVGWAGNPYYKDKNFKGFFNIIKPVCEELAKKYPIVLKTALAETKIPFSKMPQFYNELDCYVCASLSESGPNPVLEAAASGVPVITTKVGITPVLIKDGFNGLFITRSRAELKEAILKLYDNQSLREKMGVRLRKEILKNWTYKKLALNYKKVFDFIIK